MGSNFEVQALLKKLWAITQEHHKKPNKKISAIRLAIIEANAELDKYQDEHIVRGN